MQLHLNTFNHFVLKRTDAYFNLNNCNKTISTALIRCKLDCCNSLYHSIALKVILKLQRVQHYLERIVARSPHFAHSLPLLKSLYWLPVRYRIIFKICTITYQTLSSQQPAYIHSLLTPARQPRQLRSSNLLLVSSVKTNVGTRAFSVAAPTLSFGLVLCRAWVSRGF